MSTYRFIITKNGSGFSVEVIAESEEEAMVRLNKAYPEADDGFYIAL